MNVLLLAALLSVGVLQSQEPGYGRGVRLESHWSADTVHLGEPVTLRLELTLAGEAVPHFPELALTDPGVTLVKFHLEPLAVEYVLSFWNLGRTVLPGIPVKYVLPDGEERIIQTDSLSIMIVSVLTGEDRDIREIKSMVAVSLTDPRLFWLRVGLIILMVVVIVFIWRRRQQIRLTRARAEARIRPTAAARLALAQLKKAPYQPRQAADFYLELSRILRQYMEQRFLFRSMEMTTSEIKKVLPEELDNPSTAVLIGQLLEQSDLAKFTGQSQSRNRWRNDVDLVERIIERTRPTFRV